MNLVILGVIIIVCGTYLLWRKNKSISITPKNAEIKYYEDIEKYIKTMGYYEKLLEIEGTDREYCIAAMKVRKAGYLSRQPEKVVGALIMDSASKYKSNREYSLIFLESVENQFLNATSR